MSKTRDEADAPLKAAIFRCLPSFLRVCFPPVAKAVDWRKAPVFLDKELQKIVRDAALGSQRADILVRLQLKNGQKAHFLLHIEFQGQKDDQLPLRIYRYNRSFAGAFNLKVASLAILGDHHPNWRPDRYEDEFLGNKTSFSYPVCKLLDLASEPQKLLSNSEPSAVVILANWAAHQTKGDMAGRKQWKWD